MDEIMLSICVPTYNHEKYIVQALDSILAQKTRYKYEVLVGEDCSTDDTRNVLMEYENKHPGKFTIYYREKNMSNHPEYTNTGDLKRRCRGKYVITLEGDDFWIDNNKIEEQIDFLENHPDYIAVSHNCLVVDDNSEPNGEEYPECKDEEYTLEHYMMGILPGQYATIMHRNYFKEEIFDTSLITKRLVPGDRLLYFSVVSNGKIHCIQKKMTAYRHVTHTGSSFSATHKKKYDYNYNKRWHIEQIKYAHKINNKMAIKVSEMLYISFLNGGLKEKKISLIDAIKSIGLVRYKLTSIIFLTKRKFMRKKYTLSDKTIR